MIFWLLTSEFPPLYGGGISTYCLETVNMLSTKGHQVTVFINNSNQKEITESYESGIRIIYFNPNNYYTTSFLGYEANLSYAFSQVIKKYLEKEGCPDILETQEYQAIAYYTLQFKHLNFPLFKDLKVLVTLHAPNFLYAEYNRIVTHRLPHFFIGEMEKFCIIAADIIISPSYYLVQELNKRMDLPNEKIHIVPNPYQLNFDIKDFSYEKDHYVFFGKLTPQKGCLELLNAFEKIWNKGCRYKLTVIGGGNHLFHPENEDMIHFLQNKYKKYIENGLLFFPGSVPPSKINNYLNQAHVIIIPSLTDNLPYTVLETMGVGKIVLVSAQGGQKEVITNHHDGFIFDHETKDDLIHQIEEIREISDKDLKNISGLASEKIKKNYNYDTIYEKKIEILNLLSSKNIITEFPFVNPQSKTQLNEPVYNNDALTVIIPFYNMGLYIDECIESIHNNHHKNTNIIIVNDGSNDPYSLKKLNEIEKKHNCQVIHQENKGLSETRNTGARASQTDYITFLDPDDTIEPDYYTKAIDILKNKKNIYFVGCWAKYFGDSNQFWPAFTPEAPYILIHNMINSSALIYKKSAFIACGWNDPKMIYGMEDYDSVISLIENGFHGVVIPEPLWNYRIRKNSMARAFTTDKQLYLYRQISEKHKSFFSRFASEISNILNSNGPGINYDNPTIRYSIPGTRFLGQRISHKIINLVKFNPVLRPIALLYKKIFIK